MRLLPQRVCLKTVVDHVGARFGVPLWICLGMAMLLMHAHSQQFIPSR
jgi:hypothetical protein